MTISVTSGRRVSHTAPGAVFDDRNILGYAGLVPLGHLADAAELAALADKTLSVPTDKGANAGAKVTSLVMGMVAGADSIDDMALLRHGATPRIFAKPYAPSTLGSFLRAFTFGHVRQLDAVASQFLASLAVASELTAGIDQGRVFVDLDDTIVEVFGGTKQGAGFGYSGVRGLNALLATITTDQAAPVIAAQRLRKGSCGSSRGAARIVADTLATVRRLRPPQATNRVLVRADSAFYGHQTVSAALKGGADVSITVRLDPRVRAAIAQIPETSWTTIEYTDAVYDGERQRWISRAEVAEIPFTAFTSKKIGEQVAGRLVVRRIPDLNQRADAAQATLFDTWRFHAFFTTTDVSELSTVEADKVHRHHAIIEQVHADLKASALAHLPSGRFCANSAWLVLAAIAFNLTRAAASLTGARLARANTATIRRNLIAVPARIARSARRLTLHLPNQWPWENDWMRLYISTCGPPGNHRVT